MAIELDEPDQNHVQVKIDHKPYWEPSMSMATATHFRKVMVACEKERLMLLRAGRKCQIKETAPLGGDFGSS